MFKYTPSPELPENVKAAVESAQNRVDALGADENRLMIACDEHRSTLASLLREIESRGDDIETQDAMIVRNKTILEEQEDTIATNESRISSLNSAVISLTEDRDKLRKEKESEIETRDELREENEKLKAENTALKAESASKREQLEQALLQVTDIFSRI